MPEVHIQMCTQIWYWVLSFSVKVAEVKEEMTDSQEEENEGSAVTTEDAQATQELPLEAVIQSGTAEEMEAEGEAQVNYLIQVKVNVVLLHDLSSVYTLFGSYIILKYVSYAYIF